MSFQQHLEIVTLTWEQRQSQIIIEWFNFHEKLQTEREKKKTKRAEKIKKKFKFNKMIERNVKH